MHPPPPGYATEEYLFAGVATTYEPDGATADFRTRIVVHRPVEDFGISSGNAAYLVTYVNVVAPRADDVFDGYLIHGRPGAAAPLTGWDGADRAGTVRVRDDGPAPVLVLQTETDVVGVLQPLGSRQPDTDCFRLWAVAGTAPGRVDRSTIVDGALELDDDGIARGDVRTPWVDVPTTVLSGLGQEETGGVALLFGSTRPLPARHPDQDAYLEAFARSAHDAAAKGFLLAADVEEACALAAAAY